MAEAFDLIIRNAKIIDGSGGEPFTGDAGIKGDRIAEVGNLSGAQAERVIDAGGMVLSPGFIDCHSHAEMSIYKPEHVKILSPLVRQGITTFIGGNCGISVAPIGTKHRGPLRDLLEAFTAYNFGQTITWDTMGQFFETLESRGLLLNAGVLVPHGLLRIHAMGLEARHANEDELRDMETRLEESLEAGALGLSTGLQYFPGSQSNTEELVRLGKHLKKYGGIFTSHLRSYSNTLKLAIDEVLAVARQGGVPAQVSHIFWVPDLGYLGKVSQPLMRGACLLSKRFTIPLPLDSTVSGELDRLDKIEKKEGVRVRMDIMPTTTGFTHLFAFFPPWALEGSVEAVLRRLQNPETRLKMRRSIEGGKQIWPHEGDNWSMNLFKIMGWECARIMSVISEKNKRLEGMTLCAVARERRCHPFEAACQLLMEEEGHVLIFESMGIPDDNFTEQSTFAAIKHPLTPISTDTILLGFGRPSFLFYGCYPKFLGRYVRERKMLSLPLAIRKITSLPAEHFGLKDRGRVQKGYFADLTVFDPDHIATRSDFYHPDMDPIGIHYVTVNGKLVVDGGNFVIPEQLPGHVLRRQTPA